MLRLYRDVLGMPVVAAWEDGTALRVGAGLILLFDREGLAEARGARSPSTGRRGPSHLALLASPEDYEAWREGLARRGGRDRPRAGVERSGGAPSTSAIPAAT